MIPEKIPVILPGMMDISTDLSNHLCQFGDRWIIAAELVYGLGKAVGYFEEDLAFEIAVTIISGWRDAITESGLPHNAPDNLSTHRSCPATGADVWFAGEITYGLKVAWGRAVQKAGLRWGGGSPVGADGVPSDWNHVDLGPRKQ